MMVVSSVGLSVLRKPILRLIGLAVFCLYSANGAAEKSREQKLLGWYQDYGSNNIAVAQDLNTALLARIRDKKNIYQHQLFYLHAVPGSNTRYDFKIGFFSDVVSAKRYVYQESGKTNRGVEKIAQQEHADVITAFESVDGDSDTLVFIVNDNHLKSRTPALLDKAKAFYVSGNYQKAQAIYFLLSMLADDANAAWAMELVGLCYEKQGKLQAALEQYQYLTQSFPNSSGGNRIEQRVRAIESAGLDEKSSLKTSKKGDLASRVFYRGTIGQNVRTMSRSVDGGDKEEVFDATTTDFSLRASGKWQNHELSMRTNGYRVQDKLNEDNNISRLKRGYIEYRNAPKKFSVSLGRQREFDSGVFTSFDGATATYSILDDLDVSISAGEPVYFSDFYDDLDYKFYSVYSNWDINKSWQLNSYYVKQSLEDVTDREAVGVLARYLSKDLTSNLVLDYDIAFSELNSLLFNGQYSFTGKSDLSFHYGKQRAPFLTATNIFIGQADLDLDFYLSVKENRDSLLEDALERTSLNNYVNVSLRHELEENVDISLEYSRSVLSDVPTSEFLSGTAEYDVTEFNQSTFGVRLMGQGVLVNNDTMQFGVRQTNGSSSKTSQIYLLERVRIANKLSINPKIYLSALDFKTNNNKQYRARMSLMLSYRPIRNAELTLEAGNETIDEELTKRSFDSDYVFAGVRFSF